MLLRPTREKIGLLYGLVAVIAFGFTLPATRLAISDLGAEFIGLGRALVAGIAAALILLINKETLPSLEQLKSLIIVAFGVIFGFPLLSAWAMEHLPASHGAVILALLPLATAGAAVFRAGERPSFPFWIASLVGSLTVLYYGLREGFGQLRLGDLALLGAVISAAIGYAEGGRLAREMPGWKIISWALVLSLPVLTGCVILTYSPEIFQASLTSWICFGYLSMVSQLLAFFAWYSGLALGGVAKVSQLQYLQPFVTVLASAWLLQERITADTVEALILVVISVMFGRRATVKQK
jgi:drug/metabolite transporter (DMT)-like permease